jgi:hypothetical protein
MAAGNSSLLLLSEEYHLNEYIILGNQFLSELIPDSGYVTIQIHRIDLMELRTGVIGTYMMFI